VWESYRHWFTGFLFEVVVLSVFVIAVVAISAAVALVLA